MIIGDRKVPRRRRRLLNTWSSHKSGLLSLVLQLFVVLEQQQRGQIHVNVNSFRISNDDGTPNEMFAPYAEGFVGKYGDPFLTFLQDKVNEGAPNTPSQPVVYDGVHARQMCPSMVGPLGDGLYYCISREHGYCDRRSGTCVCNVGYMGLGCQSCAQTHYSQGRVCYPKKVCPNDCSGAGSCDFSTGLCTCEEFATGDDCSAFACSAAFDPLCESCSNSTCSACIQGYSVNTLDNTCQECGRFDPRCTECESSRCVRCGDPLLYSTRRSGRQLYHPHLPRDEWMRQLRHALPFGSQSSRFFDDVEVFQVVRDASKPLNETAVDCDQGSSGAGQGPDWVCTAVAPGIVSHRVCGSPGTLTWASPEYEVAEGLGCNGTVRVRVVRTGGGYGDVSVTYELRHLTTSDSDVTAHSVSEDSQVLTLTEGVVSVSFLITVHDDSLLEGDEAFELLLLDPTGGARLGPQWITKVWIRDDDAGVTGADTSECYGDALVKAEAGQVMNFTILSRSTSAVDQQAGGDTWVVYLDDSDHSWAGQYGQSASLRMNGWVTDEGDGNYSASYIVQQAGIQHLHVLLARKGGLLGQYFDDTLLGAPPGDAGRRQVDRSFNMTWPNGRLTAESGGYSSVRWQGYLLPPSSEEYTLRVDIAGIFGQVRLWLDDAKLLDIGGFGNIAGRLGSVRGAAGNTGSATVMLTQGYLHGLVIEYRSRRGAAGISLQWESGTIPLEIIPHTALYWAEDVQSSPWTLQVLSSMTDASRSDVYGTGLSRAVASQVSTFTIIPKDAFGNLRDDVLDRFVAKSDAFTAVLTLEQGVRDGDGNGKGGGGMGSTQVTGDVEYNPARATYEVNYTPYVSGVHLLNITYQSWGAQQAQHIQRSPFTVVVEPGPPFAKRCRVDGIEVMMTATAGQINDVTVVTRDVMDNMRQKGGDDVEVFVHNLKNPYVHEGLVSDSGDGTYNITLWPVVAGQSLVSITLDGYHLAESPYVVTIIPAAAYGPACVAFGPGTVSAVATMYASFYVQARDRFGNNLWDINNFTVNATLVAKERLVDTDPVVHSSVQADALYLSNGSGLALVTYRPELSGASFLLVEVDGRPINGSPFAVQVEGGPSTGNATASGPALSFAVAGNMHSFDIQARDSNGNPTERVGEEEGIDNASGVNCSSSFNVTLLGGKGGDAVVWGSVSKAEALAGSESAGVYRVEYNTTEEGTYSLEVIDCQSGEHIVGSPFALYVGSNIAYAPRTVRWWKKQVAGRNKVLLQAQDFWGNNATAGGETFVITWEPSRSLTYAPSLMRTDLPVRVVDLGDGTYTVYTGAVGAGDYNMTLYVIEGGGLWGQFHGAMDLLSEKADWHTKGAVDMDWGLLSPAEMYGYAGANTISAEANLAAFPADYFSVIFNGYVIAPGNAQGSFGEDFTFLVTTDESSLVRLSIGGNVLWDEISGGGRTTTTLERKATYLLRIGEPTSLELRYVHTDSSAAVKLEWMSASTPRQVIPSSALAHARAGGSENITLWPAEAATWASTTEGEGLHTARVGATSSFTIIARDAYGNRQWSGGLTPTAFAKGADGSMLHSTVTDKRDGTYEIAYYPTTAGLFVLSVALAGLGSTEWDMGYNSVDQIVATSHTSGSPHTLVIHTGPTAANTTVVYDDTGAGLSTCTAGGMYGQSSFIIQARDKHGNRRSGRSVEGDGGEEKIASSSESMEAFTVILRHRTDNAAFKGHITFIGGGEYLVTYNATVAGDYDAHIYLQPGGEELANSPYSLSVVPGPAYGPTSTCEDCGTRIANNFNAVIVHITARDRWGNARGVGGEHWYIEVTGSDDGFKRNRHCAPVYDLGDGTYWFKFAPPGVGILDVHVSLANRITHDQRPPGLGGGGLHGTYWTNILMYGEPVEQRDDAAPLHYDWGTGAMLAEGTITSSGTITPGRGVGDYVSVRWSGLIRPHYTSTYTLTLEADNEARLFISENLVIDTSHGSNTGRYCFIAEQLEKVKVEFVEKGGVARVSLYWSCLSTPKELVPPARLFPSCSEIVASPFRIISPP